MSLRFVVDGCNIPVTNMYDIDGEETDDPFLAVVCVGPLPDGRWLATKCLPEELKWIT